MKIIIISMANDMGNTGNIMRMVNYRKIVIMSMTKIFVILSVDKIVKGKL